MGELSTRGMVWKWGSLGSEEESLSDSTASEGLGVSISGKMIGKQNINIHNHFNISISVLMDSVCRNVYCRKIKHFCQIVCSKQHDRNQQFALWDNYHPSVFYHPISGRTLALHFNWQQIPVVPSCEWALISWGQRTRTVLLRIYLLWNVDF